VFTSLGGGINPTTGSLECNALTVAETFLAPAWSDNDRSPMRQILV